MAPADALVRCDPTAPFATPVEVAGLNVAGAYTSTFQLTPDELTGFFYSNRPAGGGSGSGSDYDIYYATRPDLASAFTVSLVTTVDIADVDVEKEPAVSPDGTVLVFSSDRPPSAACCNLYGAVGSQDTFATAAELSILDSTDVDYHPFYQLDSDIMWFASNRTGDFSIYETTYSGATFTAPLHVTDLDVPGYNTEVATVLTGGLVMYFRSDRPGGGSGLHIWRASRTTTTDPWGAPVLEAEVDSPELDTPNWISRDGCRLYMSSSRNDPSDIFVAVRTPN